MSKFNLFKPWTWFQSEERNKRVEQTQGYSGTTAPYPEANLGIQLPSLVKNIYFTGSSVVVVLSDGQVIMKNGVDASIVTPIQNCKTVVEIEQLLSAPEEIISLPRTAQEETKEEREIVSGNLAVLQKSEDFTISGKTVFLKDVPLELPAVVVGSFIELLERAEIIQEEVDKGAYRADYSEEEAFKELSDLNEKYEALKMFWYWTALNPIANARKDLFHFIRTNDITLSTNGLLIMYRRVVAVDNKTVDRKLVEFISNSYTKVKGWKKSPKNYNIVYCEKEGYSLVTNNTVAGQILSGGREFKGNLQDLYDSLDKLQGEKTYTDRHTHSKDIKIGQVYKEDEDKIDLDNTRDCSSGLHVGSRSFGFDGFGDVGVLCLVNPMYVRSVPVSYTNKMRVSEMFIAGEMTVEEYSENVENQQIMDYSQEYCSMTVDALKQSLKDKTYECVVQCQGNKPAVAVREVPNILKHIQERVMEVV